MPKVNCVGGTARAGALLGLLASAFNVQAQQAGPAAAVARYEELYRQSGNGSLLWLLAETHAAAGQKDEAIKALTKLADLRLGFVPTSDSAVAKLAGDPRYDALAARMAKEFRQVRRAREAAKVAKPDLVPEGIAVEPASGRLFIGDQASRSILEILPGGAVRPFAQQLELRPLGMTVDHRRGVLWVATTDAFAGPSAARSALLAFDIKTGRLVTTARSPETKSLNDVAIAPDGSAFVTDSIGGAVFRLQPGTTELKRVSAAGGMSYPNGIAVAADGKTLFVAQGVALRRINVDTGEVMPVAQPPQLATIGLDGLYRHEGRLIGIQNIGNPGRVLLLDLNLAGTAITRFEVLEAGNPDFQIPTTAALSGDKLFVLANTQLDRLTNAGTISEGPPLRPIKVLEIVLPKE